MRIPRARTGSSSSGAVAAYGDLRAAVRRRGIEGALSELRDAGVHVTLEEFKGLRPIIRKGLLIESGPEAFDSTRSSGGIAASTSGSRSAGTQVMFGWDLIADEDLPQRGDSELITIDVPAGSPAVDRQIVELGLPSETLVLLAYRGEGFFAPNGSTIIRPGDKLIVLTNERSVDETRHILQGRGLSS